MGDYASRERNDQREPTILSVSRPGEDGAIVNAYKIGIDTDKIMKELESLGFWNERTRVAEELLTKVCNVLSKGQEDFNLNEFPGLPEWWEKNRPKTEREKKKELVARELMASCPANESTMQLAERILKALGE